MNAYDDDQHDRPSSALSSATTGTTHPPDEPRSGVKRKAEEVAGRVRTEVDSAAHRLRRRARDAVDGRRHELATTAQDLGAAIHAAADELRQRGEERTAAWAETLAEQIHSASSYLENHDLRGLLSDIEDAARRRPGLVLGGLFLAGLATARFVKSSHRRRERDDERERWMEHNDPMHAPSSAAPVPATPRGGVPELGGSSRTSGATQRTMGAERTMGSKPTSSTSSDPTPGTPPGAMHAPGSRNPDDGRTANPAQRTPRTSGPSSPSNRSGDERGPQLRSKGQDDPSTRDLP